MGSKYCLSNTPYEKDKFLLIGGKHDAYIYQLDEGVTLPDKIDMGDCEYFAHSVGRFSGPHYVYYSDKEKLNPTNDEMELLMDKLDEFYSKLENNK